MVNLSSYYRLAFSELTLLTAALLVLALPPDLRAEISLEGEACTASSAHRVLSIGGFSIESRVGIGDALTSLTIAVSAAGLFLSWRKEVGLREKEQADRIRGAAAKTLAKLERWKEHWLTYYRTVDQYFVEATEMLEQDYNVHRVRDCLWRRLSATRIEVLTSILQEQIETAYIDLYAYNPSVYSSFVSTLDNMKRESETQWASFMANAQACVLSWDGQAEHYAPAKLGNQLRFVSGNAIEQLKASLQGLISPVQTMLENLIGKEDTTIIRERKTLTLLDKNR